jgi:drug/metabolite transporter (DMT)-like permease
VGLRGSLKADIALIGIAGIWGGTFVVVKNALHDASPFAFLAVRFTIGAAALGWIFRRRIVPVRRGQIRDGAVLALFLGGGFACQTIGLLSTTPSRSAFITGLYVVGVPLIAAALRLRGLTPASLAGAGMALTGLYFMTGAGGAGDRGGIGPGEALTLCCAALFAAHIVGVDIITRRQDPAVMSFWQVALTAAASAPLALLAETPRLNPTPALAGALLATGLGATALAVGVQNAVQARTTPTRTAIIFASEPVFAAAASWILEGEVLTGAALGGAALILAGMLVAEIPASRTARPLASSARD